MIPQPFRGYLFFLAALLSSLAVGLVCGAVISFAFPELPDTTINYCMFALDFVWMYLLVKLRK